LIEGIIFDFDGVLVESVDVKTQAFAKLFEQYGSDVVQQVVNYHLANGGLSRFAKIKYYYSDILEKPLTDCELDLLCEQFSDMVVEQVVNAPPVKGVKPFLNNNYTEYDLFIVSGTPQDEIRNIVRRRGINQYFKGVFGSPADKVMLTRHVIEMNNLDKEKFLFVGDALTDYDAARRNEINFVGRVPPGSVNIFPRKVKVIADLTELDHIILSIS